LDIVAFDLQVDVGRVVIVVGLQQEVVGVGGRTQGVAPVEDGLHGQLLAGDTYGVGVSLTGRDPLRHLAATVVIALPGRL
jgi:hypothetical protein